MGNTRAFAGFWDKERCRKTRSKPVRVGDLIFSCQLDACRHFNISKEKFLQYRRAGEMPDGTKIERLKK